MAGKPAVEYWWYCEMCGRSSLYLKDCKRITHANNAAHEFCILRRGLVRAMISMCFAIAWLVELES